MNWVQRIGGIGKRIRDTLKDLTYPTMDKVVPISGAQLATYADKTNCKNDAAP
jgi:hypothetical protein